MTVAVAVAVTVQIPGKSNEPFNQMILTQTLPLINPNRPSWLRRIWAFASGLGLALLALTVPVRASAVDKQTFASPQEAVNALVVAAGNHDTNALHSIFGPEGHALISPDAVQATEGFKMFVQRLTLKTQLINNSDSNATTAPGWMAGCQIVVLPVYR